MNPYDSTCELNDRALELYKTLGDIDTNLTYQVDTRQIPPVLSREILTCASSAKSHRSSLWKLMTIRDLDRLMQLREQYDALRDVRMGLEERLAEEKRKSVKIPPGDRGAERQQEIVISRIRNQIDCLKTSPLWFRQLDHQAMLTIKPPSVDWFGGMEQVERLLHNAEENEETQAKALEAAVVNAGQVVRTSATLLKKLDDLHRLNVTEEAAAVVSTAAA